MFGCPSDHHGSRLVKLPIIVPLELELSQAFEQTVGVAFIHDTCRPSINIMSDAMWKNSVLQGVLSHKESC